MSKVLGVMAPNDTLAVEVSVNPLVSIRGDVARPPLYRAPPPFPAPNGLLGPLLSLGLFNVAKIIKFSMPLVPPLFPRADSPPPLSREWHFLLSRDTGEHEPKAFCSLSRARTMTIVTTRHSTK